LETYDPTILWETVNSSLEKIDENGEAELRWTLQPGEGGILKMKPEHPLFSRLRYFDRLEFEFRIVSGHLDSMLEPFRDQPTVTAARGTADQFTIVRSGKSVTLSAKDFLKL